MQASWSRNQMLRGSLSKRRCQCSFRSYCTSNGGKAAASLGVSAAKRVTTAYGSVATSGESITMKGTLNTFAERFFRAQLVFQQPEIPAQSGNGDGARGRGSEAPRKPTKRYNALGILEDIPEEEPTAAGNGVAAESEPKAEAPSAAEAEVLDVGPAEPPKKKVAARPDPVVVGAGRARSLNPAANAPAPPADWSNVGRNDPCPCGSGKKFKKCHGASL